MKAILRTLRYSGIESSSRKSFLAKSHLFGSDKKILDRFLFKIVVRIVILFRFERFMKTIVGVNEGEMPNLAHDVC